MVLRTALSESLDDGVGGGSEMIASGSSAGDQSASTDGLGREIKIKSMCPGWRARMARHVLE